MSEQPPAPVDRDAGREEEARGVPGPVAERGPPVGDLNAVSTWWLALATDLGEPASDFYCLGPAAGFARAAPCPAPGRVLGRDFARARVPVNPVKIKYLTG